MTDPLVEYHKNHPRAKNIPQWVFEKRFKLGFCNSPKAYSLMKKEEVGMVKPFKEVK